MQRSTRPLTLLILLVVFANLGFTADGSRAWQHKVEAQVLSAAGEGETEFLIFLTEQADLSEAARLKTRLEKGRYVYERLNETARRTQGLLIEFLTGQGAPFRPFWVVNMIWVRGDQELVQVLARRSDVAYIYANPHVLLDEPDIPWPPEIENRYSLAPDTLQWNILKVGAPAVWEAGYQGQGVVIGGQDTGYEWTHPALKNQYRGWNGTEANHNYNWHDAIHANDPQTAPGNPCGFNTSQPCDDGSHGTHTMGTMVGSDGGANQIGVAPGARWIGCRNMEEGRGTPASYSECYQWFIAPTDLEGQNPRPDLAPHIINNSWTCPPGEGCVDPGVLQSVVENVRAAGILTVHSAGNSGSGCSTIDTPAAIYDASFTVGNTDINDQISLSSSRGPVIVDDSGRLKPDITAPGTNIRSSTNGGTYGTLTGTSMAGPHVAGAAALLISAQPALAGQPDQLEALLEQSAVPLTSSQVCGGVPGSNIPNNTYGWGRVDALAAFNTIHGLAIHKHPSAYEIQPGNVLTYTLSITNTLISATTNVVLTDTLPANTTFISATSPHTLDESTIRWDFASLSPDESRSVQFVVQVPVTAIGTVENREYGVRSDEMTNTVTGPVISTRIVAAPGVALSPDQTRIAPPGSNLTYTHLLTNTSPEIDTIDLSYTSSQGWAQLATASPVTLEPGQSTTVEVTVHIPANAPIGSQDTTVLIARSQNNPAAFAMVTDTTRVLYVYYFPFVGGP